MKKKRIHIIPVGGDEPVHTAHETCGCQPLLDEDGLMVHHAQDLREARERHGRNRSDEKWVLVEEVLANTQGLVTPGTGHRDESAAASRRHQ